MNAIFASYDWFTGWVTNPERPLWLRIVLAPFALVLAGLWTIAAVVISLGILFLFAVAGIIVLGLLSNLWGLV